MSVIEVQQLGSQEPARPRTANPAHPFHTLPFLHTLGHCKEDEEDQSADDSLSDELEELEAFCNCELLSVEALQGKICSIPPDAIHESSFFHDACENSTVSLEVVNYLLEKFPGAAGASTCEYCPNGETVAYPLHLACYNKNCPRSVIALLMKKNTYALGHLCIVHDGVPSSGFDDVQGVPLHYYLARESNIDIDVVRMLVEAYPDALTTADDTGFTPLHILLCNPNIADMCDILQFLIEAEPSSLRMTCGFDEAPLHLAC